LALVLLPQAERRRAREGRQAAEALGQLAADVGEQLGPECPALVVGQRQE
jgi:hypothetical protein